MYDHIKICSKCGAKYEIYKFKLIIRDKDSLDCDICGEQLMKWNGAEMFTSKLIEPKNTNLE